IIAIVGRAHASQPARPKTGPVGVRRPPRSTEVSPVKQSAPAAPAAPVHATPPVTPPAQPEPVKAKVTGTGAAVPGPGEKAPVKSEKTSVASGPSKGPAKPLEKAGIPDIVKRLAASTGIKRVDRKILQAVPLKGERKTVEYPEHAEIWITRDDSGLSELIFEEFENQFIPCRLVSLDYLEFVESPDQIAGIVIVGPRDTCNMDTLNNMFHLMRMAARSLRRKDVVEGQNPLIVSIVRLDGAFGLSGRGVDFQPMTAALAGMTKSLRHEWPEIRCKIIDIEADRSYQPDIADLMQELFLDGPLEMGISSRGKVQLALVDLPMDAERLTGEPLVPGDWVLVTGGARGVTAVCAYEIARRFGVNLVLVGRSDPPAEEPDWLTGLSDEAAIKQAIMDHQKTKVSPKELNRMYERWMKNREMSRTLSQVSALGVQARYEVVDVTDAEALDKVIHRYKREKIVFRGLIHGAGIIADKLLEEKDPDDFNAVIRTKVESLRYLSEYLDLDQLKILVLFSSSTARFGRRGQVDYAMANEVLNKFAHKFASIYPACRTLAVNWGPWDGGMVTPELRKVFESEGIDVIDPASGARYLSRELRMEYGTTVPVPVEIVILGTREEDRAYPGDLEPVWEDAAQGAPGASRDGLSRADVDEEVEIGVDDEEMEDAGDDAGDDDEVALELVEAYRLPISVKRFPILKSHLINGMPVVPMALLMELAARGAVTHHAHLSLHCLENFRLLKGIILRPDTEFELECKVGEPVREDRSFRIPVELRGIMPDGKKFVHVSTDAILVPRLPASPEAPEALENPEPYPIHQAQLYSEVLFHGEMLQSIRSVEGVSDTGITAAVDGVPAPAEWMTDPISDEWITDPMSVDAAFQLMILWTELMLEMPSLPTGFKAYRQYRKDLPSWSYADIRVTDHRGSQVFADIWFKDDENRVIAVIESYECITDKGLRDAFRVRKNES
ncbi:MAG TPA: KR domain-containing protein, partial [bacterium]|nr:KR domain-containing protein [bacterium]